MNHHRRRIIIRGCGKRNFHLHFSIEFLAITHALMSLQERNLP